MVLKPQTRRGECCTVQIFQVLNPKFKEERAKFRGSPSFRRSPSTRGHKLWVSWDHFKRFNEAHKSFSVTVFFRSKKTPQIGATLVGMSLLSGHFLAQMNEKVTTLKHVWPFPYQETGYWPEPFSPTVLFFSQHSTMYQKQVTPATKRLFCSEQTQAQRNSLFTSAASKRQSADTCVGTHLSAPQGKRQNHQL